MRRPACLPGLPIHCKTGYFVPSKKKPLNEQDHSLAISVIVPNYNGIDIIPKCLSSLSSMSLKPDETVVVDNGSTDGSQELVRRDFPNVILVELPENTGFTGANNTGLKASSGDFIVLLNNDCIAEKNWLLNLRKRMNDPSIGAVASSMRNMRDPEIMDSAGGSMDWMGFTADSGRGDPAELHCDPVSLPFACGGAVMLRREALPDPGQIFWNELFIYQEDVDLGIELNRTGWRVIYEPDAVVRHEHSATMRRVNYYKEHLLTRNRLLVMRKHFGEDGFKLIAPHIKRWQHAWIAVSILRGRFPLAKALFTGTAAGLRNPVKTFTAKLSVFDVYNRFAVSAEENHPLKRSITRRVRNIIRHNSSFREELK